MNKEDFTKKLKDCKSAEDIAFLIMFEDVPPFPLKETDDESPELLEQCLQTD